VQGPSRIETHASEILIGISAGVATGGKSKGCDVNGEGAGVGVAGPAVGVAVAVAVAVAVGVGEEVTGVTVMSPVIIDP